MPTHEEGKNMLMRQFVGICNNHLAATGKDPEQALASVVQVLAALADVQGSMVAKLPDPAQRAQALENLTARMAMVVAMATAGEAQAENPPAVPAARQTVDAQVETPPAAPVHKTVLVASETVPVAPKIAPARAAKPVIQVVQAQSKQRARGPLPSIDD